jgi:hypothetical protein
VFRTQLRLGVSTDGSNFFRYQFRPFLIVPTNSDVIVTAEASTTAVSISASFNTLLALVQ